jgi:hypothetical protein
VNPLLEHAQNVGEPMTDEDKKNDEQNPSVNEPAVGSYERFMHSFGSPQRWAGR